MAINFPDSPANGDTHVVGNVTYVYNNAKNKWDGAGQTPVDRLVEGSNILEINASNNLLWSGGNVGINDTSPDNKLHITTTSSTAYSTNTTNTSNLTNALLKIQNLDGTDGTGVNNYVGIQFSVANGATSTAQLQYVRTGDNAGKFEFKARNTATNYPNIMTLRSDGNVGVGTNSPTKGSFFGGDQRVFHISGSAAPELRVQSSTSGQGDLSIVASNSAKKVHIYNRASNASTSFATTDSGDNLIQDAFEVLGRGLARGSTTRGIAPANGSVFFSAATSGDFTLGLDLFNLPGNAWWNTSLLCMYAGVDGGLSNQVYNVALIRINGLSDWELLGVSNIVGTTSVLGSNNSSSHIDLDFDVANGNRGTFACWVMSPNNVVPTITFTG